MKREQFIQYLENPLLLNEASITELKSVVDAYPFFQTAHLLYAKALSNVNHADYYSGLKRTSIIAGDRKVLYELITKKSDTESLKKIKEEKTLVPENKIAADNFLKENISEEISLPEIKLVSNITNNPKDIAQNFDFAKQKESEIPTEKKEKVTRVELIVTTKEEKANEELAEKNSAVLDENRYTSRSEEKNLPTEKNVDDIVLNQVVNAYIEKEYLEVTEIDKPKKKEIQINPEEGKKILTQTLNEPHSFSQWLQLLSHEKKSGITEKKPAALDENRNTSRSEELTVKPVSEEKSKQDILIEKLIKEEPKISKLKQDIKFFTPNAKAKESIVKDETLVTETLAWILEKQGKYPEAINAYRTLSLKYPEKSVYFASLISKIRNKQKQK